MAKNVQSKTWSLPVRWNGNRYSEASDVPVVPAPTSFTATPSSSTMNLAWTNNATGSYQTLIERSLDGSTGWTTVDVKAAGVTSYADTGLVSGEYFYRISAISGGQASAYVSDNGLILDGATLIASDDFESATAGQNISGRVVDEITYSLPTNDVKASSAQYYSGSKSLAFGYNPETTAEQRFVLTNAHPEITVWFKLRIPDNYIHTQYNNKLFAIWMDGYSSGGNGPTIAPQIWPNGQNGSTLSMQYSEGGGNGGGVHLQYANFIAVPADRGTWINIMFYIKAATTRLTPNTQSTPYKVSDGLLFSYIKKTGGSWSKIHEITTANIAPPPGGPNGWKNGYLMGWANSGYAEPTTFYIDDFRIYSGDARSYVLGF